jgi:hypothetical protein
MAAFPGKGCSPLPSGPGPLPSRLGVILSANAVNTSTFVNCHHFTPGIAPRQQVAENTNELRPLFLLLSVTPSLPVSFALARQVLWMASSTPGLRATKLLPFLLPLLSDRL